MKNVVYYSTLFILWVVIHLLLSSALILILSIDGPYALAIAAVMPEVWILSIGLAMFTRKAMAKRILHEEKRYSKVISTVLVALGSVMIIANIVLSAIQQKAIDEAMPIHTPAVVENKTFAANDNVDNSEKSRLKRTIYDYKKELDKEVEKTMKIVPQAIDDVVTLEKVSKLESVYSYNYQLKIDKANFAQDDLNDIINDFGEDVRIGIYYEAISVCGLAEIDPNEFFKEANIKFKYSFSDINNSHIGTYELDYKELAKE